MTEIRGDQVAILTWALAANLAAAVFHGTRSTEASRTEAVACSAARNSTPAERSAAAAALCRHPAAKMPPDVPPGAGTDA